MHSPETRRSSRRLGMAACDCGGHSGAGNFCGTRFSVASNACPSTLPWGVTCPGQSVRSEMLHVRIQPPGHTMRIFPTLYLEDMALLHVQWRFGHLPLDNIETVIIVVAKQWPNERRLLNDALCAPLGGGGVRRCATDEQQAYTCTVPVDPSIGRSSR